MQFITAVFFTEKKCERPGDKVIYFANPASDFVTASSFSRLKVGHVINAKPKAENVHARTFELGSISYNLT